MLLPSATSRGYYGPSHSTKTLDPALSRLRDTGPITAGRLAEITGLTTGAVTGIVDRLERTGHVRRGRDPGDRRKVIIEPVWPPEHEEAAGGSSPRSWARSRRTSAEYGDRDLALILDFMDRHARTLQRLAGDVRNTDGAP